jgi:flagellar hook protein FlgE
MFQSFFNGLSGMFSFSKNLDNVSNNIANLNTPGFKGSDTFYKSLTSDDSAMGTQISGEQLRLDTGEVRQTGNPGDLAIAGEGFFVLLRDGQTHYTRAGQFIFNDDGALVDSISGSQVASVDASGKLTPISITDVRTLAPEASSNISFSGNLSTDEATHSVADLTVFNGVGEQTALTFTFTNNSAVTAGSWLVSITDPSGASVHSGEIRFGTNGTPQSAFSTLSFDLTDSNGGVSPVVVNFGNSGSFAGATSVSGGATSTLNGTVNDGFGIASITSIDFADDGVLKFNYSNGEVIDGPTLALATFSNPSTLEISQGSIFSASDSSGRTIGRPGDAGLGTIVSESIELSNVDLSREFADMIIIQRGYQASSRVLNVANELLDSLYENTRGR